MLLAFTSQSFGTDIIDQNVKVGKNTLRNCIFWNEFYFCSLGSFLSIVYTVVEIRMFILGRVKFSMFLFSVERVLIDRIRFTKCVTIKSHKGIRFEVTEESRRSCKMFSLHRWQAYVFVTPSQREIFSGI